MSPFSCMYGSSHNGQYLAVRSQVGCTVGWICKQHFNQHEKTLLSSGYHFRTQEELQARGELNGGEQTATSGGTRLAAVSAPEQQQPGNDDPGRDTPEAKLAHERPSGSDAGGRSYESASDGCAQSPSRGPASREIQTTQKELETRATGGEIQERRADNGSPDTGSRRELDWPQWCEGAGYLTLSEEQRHVLQEPFRDTDITIRYDGVVYVPWRKYWTRMVKAFAPQMPSVIPIDNPRFQGQEIIVGVVMVVGGKFIGKAWGSHRLEGSNDKMAVGDRIESAISDAIAKIGKRLDMGELLWDDTFRDYWKSQYAEQYTNRNRTSWRRKATAPIEEHEHESTDWNERGDR